jgi:hypothetical protein
MVTKGSTLTVHKLDNIMASAATSHNRQAVLAGITSKASFKILEGYTKLFYTTYIKQTSLYIKVSTHSYITSCLTKLGWDTSTNDGGIFVPMPPSTIQEIAKSPAPLDPGKLSSIVLKYGFQYRTLTGMIIFAVQIGRFDIAPTVSIICKFNDHLGAIHFQAENHVMRYLHSTIDRGIIYWRPTGKDKTDLPWCELTPYRPKSNINALSLWDFPLLDPICFVDASYGELLTIGKHRSITGIVIMLRGTAIFAKTRIHTTALSSTGSETMAGCEAGKHVKYFQKLFTDLRFDLNGPAPTGEDNQGSTTIAHHLRPSGRTLHMDLQFFATHDFVHQGLMSFFAIHGMANPTDAMSKVIYCILHRHHFDCLQGSYGPPHVMNTENHINPNDNPSPGWLL